jgi:predicted RNA-binding protein with RPS1 domain
MGIARKKNAGHGVKVAPKKKAKKEKPKHLNRKLESAATEDERRQVLLKIQELEAAKKRPLLSGSSSSAHSPPLAKIDESPNSDPSHFGEKVATTGSDDAGATARAPLDSNKTDLKENHPSSATTPPAPTDEEEQAMARGSAGRYDEDPDTTSSKRQRGKRRRGRQDTSRVVEDKLQLQEQEVVEVETKTNEVVDDKDPAVKAKRYCLGRKPVTDFKVGCTYPGKIVYAKPALGVFIDIGCHSDAFCHVSRLADDYVADVEQWRTERDGGDTVEQARVVEIDRSRKRITVSLQSAARAEDEKMSMQARQERRRKLHQRRNGKPMSVSEPRDMDASLPAEQGKKAVPGDESRRQNDRHKPLAREDRTRPLDTGVTNSPPPAKMDAKAMDAKAKAVQEKRQRKLARRAERRAVKETEGEPSN